VRGIMEELLREEIKSIRRNNVSGEGDAIFCVDCFIKDSESELTETEIENILEREGLVPTQKISCNHCGNGYGAGYVYIIDEIAL